MQRLTYIQTENYVYLSTIASLVVQVIIGFVTAFGFFLPLPEGEEDLSIVLGLELGSQIIEFLWYFTVVCFYKKIQTWSRYIDWSISTPIMIVSLWMFLRIRTNKPIVPNGNLLVSISFNQLMLAFGLGLELKVYPKLSTVFAGSMALAASYIFIARDLGNDVLSIVLFSSILFVWSLYGVAALANYTLKNILYNGLDIISKNFYGLFLFVYIVIRSY